MLGLHSHSCRVGGVPHATLVSASRKPALIRPLTLKCQYKRRRSAPRAHVEQDEAVRPSPPTAAPASSSPSGEGNSSSSPSSSSGHKFQPFLTSGQELARQQMLAFSYRAALSDGSTLLVAPVTGGWLKDMADILTDAFADSLSGGVSVYKSFLRMNILKYLRRHASLPPRSVVLMALLLPPGVEEPDIEQEDSAAGSDSYSGSSSTGSSSSSAISAPQQEQQAEDQALPLAPEPLASGLPGGRLVVPDAAAGSGDGAEAAEAADTAAAALRAAGARLVGVVELSFSESTRSRYLTLNPPPTSAYLCNMAVMSDQRGKGVGARVLAAAEAIAAAAGEREICLHLRFRDADGAPGRLYERAGFSRAKADICLVWLLGQERRYLLRKQLKPQAAAAAAQQQQQQQQQRGAGGEGAAAA